MIGESLSAELLLDETWQHLQASADKTTAWQHSKAMPDKACERDICTVDTPTKAMSLLISELGNGIHSFHVCRHEHECLVGALQM